MFSIITPTYNRAHTVDRVYNSLKEQTFKEFTWIIVDDGSTDNTSELVEQWKTSNSNINIDYHLLKENKGKPYAVNYGVKHANEEFTIIADSDDAFYSNTLNELKEIWESISDNNIAAIWSLVEDENHNIKGDKFPKNPWIVNFKERVLNRNKQLQGDKWHCWKTAILKQFPLFYDEECHIGESHTWNAINNKYNFYCINKVFLTVYNSEVSLMNSKKPKKIIARAAYLSSYYGLKDVSIKDMTKYKYYRYLAFMYIKSLPNYSSKKLKLSLDKRLIASLIFICSLPNKVIHKLS